MSQYSNGYCVSIVVHGNVVDARMDNVIAVPFGADYVLRLKNNNNRSALAKVSIDGQPVTGGGIIVRAYGTVDLERPTDKPVTFRFASTESDAAEDHGKAGPDIHGDKGLIKVEWFPELDSRPFITYKPMIPNPYYASKTRMRNASSLRGESQDAAKYCSHQREETTRGLMSFDSGNDTFVGQSVEPATEQKTAGGIVLPESTELESGVTVEGKHSNQSFRYVRFEADYSKPTVIVLKLKGYAIEDGIPRQGTNYCPNCRTRTKKDTDRYCRQCGVKLHD